ncbi:MAG: STAS domain-containing protein [Methylococcaceae bacterium]
MEINYEQLDGDIYKINLKGRMDILGNEDIDIKFSGMTAAPRKFFIIDLSEVNFIASIGIRTLLLNAKAVHNREGKIVILNPDSQVKKILLTAGIDMVMPIIDTLDLAIASMH